MLYSVFTIHKKNGKNAKKIEAGDLGLDFISAQIGQFTTRLHSSAQKMVDK